ncbi:MAG: precorrin-2 C(20)-methyltransferase [Cyanobacteria bacterium RI_101]|nr:precorrin-2 C(20)-methyltransferase [Cyanobacteria bacterium RI_101]
MTWGRLYGISVGPGDPELLTLKALRILQTVPVVAYPAGKGDKPGLAESIIQTYLAPEQIRLPLRFPYVFESETLAEAWEAAARETFLYLSQGLDVGFACEGDGGFYGTFNYLAQTLSQNYPELIIERLPGVSSPWAAAAALGLPLTLQDQRLFILPALYHADDLDAALSQAEVVVLLKFRQVYSQVWRRLQALDLLQRAWVIEWATTPRQRIYHPLTAYPELKLSYFSLLLIQT